MDSASCNQDVGAKKAVSDDKKTEDNDLNDLDHEVECNDNHEVDCDIERDKPDEMSPGTAAVEEASIVGHSNKIQVEDTNEVDDDDDGDPIPSGTGSVSKECSPSDLQGWSEILPKWHSKLNQRPKGLNSLVRNGIPEPLRGEVWQLLSGAQQSADLMEQYRIFLTRTAPTEQIILRDVHRTYPAHEHFRTGGTSSLIDSLFKVCKAYAVYDEEVGYCQGLSFLVAALLLHMPEEQAFCVFVRIMQHYGLRDLFRNNFDELYLKFYQLERLLEDHMPDLYQHFTRIRIEPFTYASQWFLTVFTAKFPLNAVFYIMDIFLLDGMNTIFQIALALLESSKSELLALDFEGVLKYFRVQMPKRYRNQENVEALIKTSAEISLKKLKKHAKNYEIVKQKEKLLENPVVRLQKENSKLTENNLRLEQENDDLARDLVASKIQLRAHMDILEEKAETLNRALIMSNQDCQNHLSTISDIEDEKSRLEVEVTQLKEVCRRELQRAESESTRDSSIIADYKKICSQLSKRIDRQMDSVVNFVDTIQDSLRDNENCKGKLCHEIFQSKANDLVKTLKSNENEQLNNSVDNESVKSNNSPRRSNSTDSDQSNRPIGAYRIEQLKSTSSESKIQRLTQHVDDLEVELARTKLALVEAECKCQQLIHDLCTGVTVKNPSSNQSGGISGKFELMKAAVTTTRRSPRAASFAFAKINNMISEKIANVNVQQSPSKLNPDLSPPVTGSVVNNNPIETMSNNNHNKPTVSDYKNQC